MPVAKFLIGIDSDKTGVFVLLNHVLILLEILFTGSEKVDRPASDLEKNRNVGNDGSQDGEKNCHLVPHFQFVENL